MNSVGPHWHESYYLRMNRVLIYQCLKTRPNAITEKSSIISSDTKLRQFAGWTARSNMHYRYQHLRGNESQDDLLRAKGIIKDDKESMNVVQPKPCPPCRELNKPDAQLCFKCGFIMSFQAIGGIIVVHPLPSGDNTTNH